jgi:uncharacterized protein YndB with AHSA1/START domain
MKEIYHCLQIEAPQEDVFRAVTERAGLSGWWTKNLEHSGKPGSVSTFRFRSGAFNRMKITTVRPDKVSWECVDGHDEWIGTRITFELRPDDGGCKVCFAHFGFERQSEYVGECSFHWAGYLLSLKNYCETGTGNPDHSTG